LFILDDLDDICHEKLADMAVLAGADCAVLAAVPFQ
jgi:hypothetical protein